MLHPQAGLIPWSRLGEPFRRSGWCSEVEVPLFKVTADSLEAYLDFDPARKPDLVEFDKLMGLSAPALVQYFHEGTPAGEPGMRMKMIGYGRRRIPTKQGTTLEWPAIGVALQKNYISVYVSLAKAGQPLVEVFDGRLGKVKMGRSHFNFVKFDDLDIMGISALLEEADDIFRSDPRRA